MRRIKLALLTLSVACSGLACSSLSVTAHPSQNFSRSEGVPTAVLAGHGQWYEVAGHGQVWRPAHMAMDWRPYTQGRWSWQDEAWTWHSDYSWGQATFHYGRWLEHGRYGWVWIPGRTWGPAWVQWRSDADHIGWAPLGPQGWSLTTPASLAWCFMERRHMGQRHVRRGQVRPARRDHLLKITRTRPAGARRHASHATVSPSRRSGRSRSLGATQGAKPARAKARRARAKPARAKAHKARAKPAKKAHRARVKPAKKAKRAKKAKKRKARAASGRARRAD